MDFFGQMASNIINNNMYTHTSYMGPRWEDNENAWKKKLARSTNNAVNEADKFGNGDQRKLAYGMPGMPGQDLADLWGDGCDASIFIANPFTPKPFAVSDFMTACIFGNAKAVKEEIEKMKALVSPPATVDAERPVTESNDAPAPVPPPVAAPKASAATTKQCSFCKGVFEHDKFSNARTRA